MGASEFSMNSTAPSLINMFQRVAKLGPDALRQLGSELKENGKALRPEHVSSALREAHVVREHFKNDSSDDVSVKRLGEFFEQPDTSAAIMKMVFPEPPVAEGESAVSVLLKRMDAFQDGDLETAYGRPRSVDSPSASDPSSGMKANRRPFDPDDSQEAGLSMPSKESIVVKLFTLVAMLTMAGYVVLRLYDVIVNVHSKERDGGRLFYRILVILAELAYGLSSCSEIVSRTRRQRLEAMSQNRKDTPFTVDDIITLLYVTDESAETIEESVRSHYSAKKPDGIPFRVVLVADAPGGAAEKVAKGLSREFGSLLHFVKEDLARQEYVMNIANEELQAALNVVLEENMYLGQVLFYCLDRLFLQYGHTISNAAVVVMPSSSVVDHEKYYPWTTSYIQQPGFACVSTPTRARNQPAVTDFLDIGQYTRENVYLTGLGGDDKFAINSQSFMARGYSLWRVLRRMEMENVDSQHLGWMTYVMHIEARQATLAASSTHAPITSVLVPTHSPTVLSTVLDRQAEGFDVAQIFDRERAFLSWNLHNPMRAMHDSARIAVLFEVVIVVVLFVTLLGNIAPWSTTSRYVAGAFLVHYGCMMLFHLATPYLPLAPSMAAAVMRNRVLVPAHAWLYFLNLSRFSVDRRGHFRAVGETTTADLVTYKQKQRAAAEETKAKAEMKTKESKEKAGEVAAEKKAKAAQEAQLLKKERQRKKEEEKAEKQEAAAAAKAAKEKEKLRRQRRGPGIAIVEGFMAPSLSTDATDIDFDVEDPRTPPATLSFRRAVSAHTPGAFTPPTAAVARRPSAPGPVAEGFFSRDKKTNDNQVQLDGEGSSVSSVPIVGNSPPAATSAARTGKSTPAPPKRDKRNLLPKTKPTKIEIPKFAVPKAKQYGRTGSGERHRPHKFIKAVSVPLAIVLMVVAAGSVVLTFLKTFGSDAPVNYSTGEILAARSWTISCALFGLYIFIAAFIYLSFVARFSMLTANCPCASAFIVISGLLVVLIGVFPFLSHAVLETRNSAFDIDGLHVSHMKFMAGMAAGEAYTPLRPGWRQDSDLDVVNPNNQRSLAGGWYTGPGLSKFTYPQAHMLVDMSLTVIAHYQDLDSMPSGAPAEVAFNRTAAIDMQELLIHGANYLLGCWDNATGTVVTHVATSGVLGDASPGVEWIAPEQRRGAVANVATKTQPATETLAAITAAYASLSIALEIYSEDALVEQLRAAANQTFNHMEDPLTAQGSYEETYPQVAAFWPSNPTELNDDKLLAAACMLYSNGGEPRFKNAVNEYYTKAQQDRAKRNREGDTTGLGGLEDYRMGADDHWWTANILLSQADSLNSRYEQNLLRFIDGWRGEYEWHQTIDANLLVDNNGLRIAMPPQWTDVGGSDISYTSPGPLPMTLRAMSYIMVHAASQQTESDVDREASCFAKGQLRHMMGLNSDGRSYFAGVALDNAASPQRAIIRPAAGPSNPGEAGGNPFIPEGALVNGPDTSGVYQDSRQSPKHNGISILNNSPLSLMLASLRSRDLKVEDCIGFKPRDKRVQTSTTRKTATTTGPAR